MRNNHLKDLRCPIIPITAYALHLLFHKSTEDVVPNVGQLHNGHFQIAFGRRGRGTTTLVVQVIREW